MELICYYGLMKHISHKLIGDGLQFRVYKISSSRVLKKETTHAQKVAKLRAWAKGDPRRLRRLQKDVIAAEQITEISIRSLKKILRRINPSIVGNPRFLNHSNYEQDYCLPLGKYITRHSLAESKIAIRRYTENIVQTWRYGFSDVVFNFTINNGVANDSVILLDLGELSFSKIRIRSLIVRKRWLTQWSYLSMQDERLKLYFRKTMNSKITPRAFEDNWKKDWTHYQKM
jgi:hypothetical protein